ncbi:MAG: glutathione S-transferase family protein [Candidatus Azotimanducaceae bacterium]
MGVKIYGVPGSRADRSLWAIEETGIDYEHVKTNFGEESKADEYLEINPNGRIPALIDGDLKLFESMAINLYLTKHYAEDLYPANPNDEAKANQWSVWAISEIEPLQMQIVIQKFFVPKDKQDQAEIDQASKGLVRPLKVLDHALRDSDYLLGEKFSVADLNVAGVMLLLKAVNFDFDPFQNVSAWIDKCHARPALERARAL